VGTPDEVIVKVVSGEPEADIACGLLRSAGIECWYRDTAEIDDAYEDFIESGPREIIVRTADADVARQLLAET
jgi:hypothetical protein